jgi:hypothetical protein
MQQALRYRDCLCRHANQRGKWLQRRWQISTKDLEPTSWKFARLKTQGPVVFKGASDKQKLAHEAGRDDIRQLKDHGDGTATYSIDLSHRGLREQELQCLLSTRSGYPSNGSVCRSCGRYVCRHLSVDDLSSNTSLVAVATFSTMLAALVAMSSCEDR